MTKVETGAGGGGDLGRGRGIIFLTGDACSAVVDFSLTDLIEGNQGAIDLTIAKLNDVLSTNSTDNLF